MDKRCGLQGIPWKDFSRDDFNLEKWDSPMRKISKKIYTGKQRDKSESVHKSWRVSKKRVMDQAFDDDEDDEDAEIRYLEKLKNSKFNAGYRGNDEGSVKKYRRFSLVSGKSGKEGKKLSRSDDTDCEEEHGPMPDGEIDSEEKKKLRKQPVDAVADPKWEMNLTTRQRALQSGKDASASGGSMVAFAKGLPPAPRKAKDKAIRC